MVTVKILWSKMAVVHSTRGISETLTGLVAPSKSLPVPNHLLDTKIFSKVSLNDVLQAKPSVVHFAGFQVGEKHFQILNIVNVSSETQRMHILPPSTKYFYIKYTKNERLVPGLSVEVTIEFKPDEWRYYYDCIRIHSKAEENLLIPIHAYPVMSSLKLPKEVNFASVPLGESKTKTIPLRSEIPIDFEFQISCLQSNVAFTVNPVSGIVPGNGEAQILVTYTPFDFSTSVMKLQLFISQFNSEPQICTFTGISQPGQAKKLKERTWEGNFPDLPHSKILDPLLIDPLNRTRIRKLKTKPWLPGESKPKVVVDDNDDNDVYDDEAENDNEGGYMMTMSCSNGGWSKDDHFHFTLLMDQYPPQMPNRRALYIDRMMREMPHKGRAQLVDHESWSLAHKSYHSQRNSILRAWSRDREDLFLKIQATFSDAWDALEDQMQKLHTRQQQEQICRDLYEKVLSFREQKLEALQLQATIAARQEEEEKALLKAAQEKEKQRREKIKNKIKTYEEQKMKEMEEAALKERQHLEELQIKLAEQAELDKERVKFREEKIKEKEELRKQALEEAKEAEREKERRLDKLREQVEVHVQADPERVFRQTQAAEARRASVYDEELELQQPLFTVYGYEDRKVSSDPRLKLEQALRSAGLHQSEYARKIMANIQPPQQPRKDQQSSVFKFDS